MAVERDQEKMSASDLLLECYLRRLGGVQSHLQSRPKAALETTGGVSGATLTEARIREIFLSRFGVCISPSPLLHPGDIGPVLVLAR